MCRRKEGRERTEGLQDCGGREWRVFKEGGDDVERNLKKYVLRRMSSRLANAISALRRLACFRAVRCLGL